MKLFAILALLTGFLRLPLTAQGDLKALASSEFLERKNAQQSLLPWIFKDPNSAKLALLDLYLTTEDPELRMRLIPMLERAFFPPTKGYVGIKMRPAFVNELGRLKGNQTTGLGIEVIQVMPKTPADRCGLRAGDIILTMNGWKIQGGLDLNSVFADRIQSNPPGEEIRLKIRRGEVEKNLTLVLSVLPTPSQRAREMRKAQLLESPSTRQVLPESLEAEMEEFRSWLQGEVEKQRNSHR